MLTLTVAMLVVGTPAKLDISTLNENVTFAHPCDNSRVVLEALGKEIGVPIKPSGSVGGDFFLVSFDDVPVQQALEKIATTLNATWSQKDGVKYLGRSRALEVIDFEREYDWKKKAIESAIAKLDLVDLTAEEAKRLSIQTREFKDAGDNDSYYKYQPTANKLPGARAMFRIIKLFDLNAIVKATGTPVIFSNATGEIPFPKGTKAIFDQMVREWAIFATQASQAGLSSDNRFTAGYQNTPPSLEVLTNRIQLSCHVSEGGVLFMLSYIADSKWQSIGYYRVDFSEASQVPEWASNMKGEVQFNAIENASILQMTYQSTSSELFDAILEPESKDVALSAPSATIIQASEKLGTNVVALVPDSAYRVLANAQLLDKINLSFLLTTLIKQKSMLFENKDGWLTARPTRPYSERRERMDRNAFSKMFRYTAEHNSLPLDVFADFAATTEEDAPVQVANNLLGRSIKMRFGLPIMGIERFRIYGLLSSVERLQTRSNHVVLSGRQDSRRFATAIAKDVSSSLEARRGLLPGIKKPHNEVNEALALLPPDTKWTINLLDIGFLQPNALNQNIRTTLGYMDPQIYAMNMLWAEKTPSKTLDYSAVAPLYGTMIYLGFEQDGAGGQGFARYVDPIGISKFGSINDLPADIKANLQEEIDKIRKRNADRTGG